MVTQAEFLSQIAIGETVSREDLLNRLGLADDKRGRNRASLVVFYLRKWRQIEIVLLGETERGARIWGHKRLW